MEPARETDSPVKTAVIVIHRNHTQLTSKLSERVAKKVILSNCVVVVHVVARQVVLHMVMSSIILYSQRHRHCQHLTSRLHHLLCISFKKIIIRCLWDIYVNVNVNVNVSVNQSYFTWLE